MAVADRVRFAIDAHRVNNHHEQAGGSHVWYHARMPRWYRGLRLPVWVGSASAFDIWNPQAGLASDRRWAPDHTNRVSNQHGIWRFKGIRELSEWHPIPKSLLTTESRSLLDMVNRVCGVDRHSVELQVVWPRHANLPGAETETDPMAAKAASLNKVDWFSWLFWNAQFCQNLRWCSGDQSFLYPFQAVTTVLVCLPWPFSKTSVCKCNTIDKKTENI